MATPTTTPVQNNQVTAIPTQTADTIDADQNARTTQGNTVTSQPQAVPTGNTIITTIDGAQVTRVATPTAGVTAVPTGLGISGDSMAQCRLVAVLVTYESV